MNAYSWVKRGIKVWRTLATICFVLLFVEGYFTSGLNFFGWTAGIGLLSLSCWLQFRSNLKHLRRRYEQSYSDVPRLTR